jgi:tetratricopeptide (TPR) repeat protein
VAALGERGDLYLRRGQVREAAEDYKAIITMEERSAGAWLGTNPCPPDSPSELKHTRRCVLTCLWPLYLLRILDAGLAKVRTLKGHMKTARKALDLSLRFATEAWDRIQKQQQQEQEQPQPVQGETAATGAASTAEAGASPQEVDPIKVQQAQRRLRDLVAAHSFKGVYLQAAGDMAHALEALDHAIHLAEIALPTTTAAEPKETDDSPSLDTAMLGEDRALLSDLYCKRAASTFAAERYDDCLRDCDLALRHSAGGNHLVRLLRGQCYLFGGRFADAIADLQLYLQAEEKARLATGSPGQHPAAEVQRQQVQEAIAHCQRALAGKT